MDIYFKTPRNSETGLKFTEIKERGVECVEAAMKFIGKYGFNSFRQNRLAFKGGISSCYKPLVDLDPKVWKKTEYGHNEYMPKLNNKEGIKIYEEIESLPYVDIDELNNIVGYEGNGLKSSHIGYSFKNKEWYGFVVNSEWECKIPTDCIEITGSEYQELFD